MHRHCPRLTNRAPSSPPPCRGTSIPNTVAADRRHNADAECLPGRCASRVRRDRRPGVAADDAEKSRGAPDRACPPREGSVRSAGRPDSVSRSAPRCAHCGKPLTARPDAAGGESPLESRTAAGSGRHRGRGDRANSKQRQGARPDQLRQSSNAENFKNLPECRVGN